MKRKHFAGLLLAAVATVAMAGAAFADDDVMQTTPPSMRPTSMALRKAGGKSLATSAASLDTTWVGYSAANHLGPSNYWNIYTGVNRPGTGDPNNAVWDFENPALAHGDSLEGWWPTIDRAGVLAVTDDHLYLYSCQDFGNVTNMKIPGGSNRTAGIVGAWHADKGKNEGIGVTWSPISGNKTAWCGLREHGDLSEMDQVTKNAYNEDCAAFAILNAAQTVKNFPGYVRQWDQMLYRDIVPVSGQDLTVSFLYRTRMSTASSAVGGGRRGWFHGDPLSTSNGNFISANVTPVIDSFQVFIGVPVDDANITLSTGSTGNVVQDPQRRWFSEVLRIWDGSGDPYYELTSAAGINPASPDTTGSVSFSLAIPWTPYVNGIVNSPDNTTGHIRLVFRVHTNSVGDDLTSSTWGELGGRGAAQVDDVKIQWGVASPITLGDFEGNEGDANNVNNANNDAVTYWKSTGKSPAVYFHARPLAGLKWLDLCGPIGASTRSCDMQGNVLDAGNDPSETLGDPTYTAGINTYFGVQSPTIDLSTATSDPNEQGISSTVSGASDDYYLYYEFYSGDFFGTSNGAFWRFGLASYPNISAGTHTACWGDQALIGTIFSFGGNHCEGDIEGMKAWNVIKTSNVSGVPDSMRFTLNIYNLPVGFGVTVGANPSEGAYFDNVSIALVNVGGAGAAGIGQVASDIWQWFNDAFPVASSVALGTGTTVAALDTCGAHVKGALNIAQLSAVAGLAGARLDVLADTIVCAAGDASWGTGDTNSTHIRVDMVFRILPGPGNYRAQAGVDTLPKYPLKPGMALLRRPDNRSQVINPADASDRSFWSEYLRDPGEFASGSHPLNAVTGKREWSNLVWNSARMDTAETNLFPFAITMAAPVRQGCYQSTLHEDDPHYADLGIPRPVCFVTDTLATLANSTNTVCGTAPAWATTVPQGRTGWSGALTTIEGTKIIPDGLLTPGSHVQYFLRKSQVFAHGGVAFDPDTSDILFQAAEGGSSDGHRWQDFSILPDCWKAPQFGGLGMACMLYVDQDDRRGDERTWVSVMDSIGGTSSVKWGAHNGWHAARGTDLSKASNPNLQSQAFVYKNAQPGTLWDMYGVKASESGNSGGTHLGGRIGLRGTGLLTGHDADIAPTADMLKQFYSAIVLMSGDLDGPTILGPVLDVPADDVALLSDFLTSNTGLVAKPRGLFIAGNGFCEAEAVNHPTFLTTQLGLSFVNESYAALAGNNDFCTDLTSTSVISATDVYGVGLSCQYGDDVIQFNPAKPGARNVSFYKNTGAGPYAASVYHARQPLTDAENFVSLVDAFDIQNLWGRYCSTSDGRLAYTYNTMSKVLALVCGSWVQVCPGFGCYYGSVDGPDRPLADFMRIGNSLVRSGQATVRFGVATTGRVRVRLYDVSGRLVRTLVDRTCAAGAEQSAAWDGRDDAGRPVQSGVYFARFISASGAELGSRVVMLR